MLNTIKGHAKGGIYENVIFEILRKNGKKVNYYKKDNSSLKIEFIKEGNGEIIPIEVKSTNGSTPSLNNFMEKYKPSVAYKLAESNIGVDGVRFTIPHYMVMFIQ